jgi:predicted ATPase
LKFHSLAIENLRAIKHFSIDELPDFVVIAGPNGCGKSCVFDAIRLLKSVYGGYLANEYHQWFGEFNINLQDPKSISKLFRDPSKPIVIDATISFADAEITYVRENLEELLQPIAWQEVTRQPVDYWTFTRLAYATQIRGIRPEIDAAVTRLSGEVISELDASGMHQISLQVLPSGQMQTAECKVAEAVFQAYEPLHLGVIEYHSASRTYSRQAVGGLNLDTRAFEDQRRQQRLYNAQAKYQNVKTELASSYLRNLIARESGNPQEADDLNETLAELFQTFFPDKTYNGVKPQAFGALDFPVTLTSGEQHDIDELSSGEKEILYGYLKLRTATPPNSVILLDEPELHLNPSLIHGFTDFYYRHLGLAQNNQLWLVTHSDTLLRQAVGNINYRVYQMVPALAAGDQANQAVEIVADDDVDRTTIAIVGDLASYHPHGKVVILEGKTENGFDVNMVKRLFPELARHLNLVSGGPKQRVRDLYEVLSATPFATKVRNRFFAIVDRDRDSPLPSGPGASIFSWDVYHIENYLLDPESIRAATEALLGHDSFDDDDAVSAVLRQCAGDLIDVLLLQYLRTEVNKSLVGAINTNGSPRPDDPISDILRAVSGSLERIKSLGDELTREVLERRAAEYRSTLINSLDDGSWVAEFPGRLIIRKYANKQLGGKIDSTLFSNSVLDKMVERGRRPNGMNYILNQILTR